MTKVLITGAAGMVGAKLVARLTKDGAVAGKPIAAIDTTTAKISKGVCAPTRSSRRNKPNNEPEMTLIDSIDPTAVPSAPVCNALWATITPPIAATASP